MQLTWRQLHVYLDAFTWILQEETKEGQQKNRVLDLRAMTHEPRLKDWKNAEREKAKRALARIKKRVE